MSNLFWTRANLRFSCKRGFTLVEVIVAVAILLILAIAFAPMISQGFGEVFRAGRLSQALQQAESRLAEERQEPESDSELTIEFPTGGLPSMKVSGHILDVDLEFEGEKSSITFFSP